MPSVLDSKRQAPPARPPATGAGTITGPGMPIYAERNAPLHPRARKAAPRASPRHPARCEVKGTAARAAGEPLPSPSVTTPAADSQPPGSKARGQPPAKSRSTPRIFSVIPVTSANHGGDHAKAVVSACFTFSRMRLRNYLARLAMRGIAHQVSLTGDNVRY
jgi:hypothetical protein